MKARKTLVVSESVESSNRKNWDLVVKNISPLNFAKYLSYSEVQKIGMLLIIGTNFSKLGV